jgi:hypothetical protein
VKDCDVSEWKRWPSARAEPTKLWLEQLDSSRQIISRSGYSGLAVFRGRSPGAVYDLAAHTACWRSYGELAGLEAERLAAALRRFARSYGPLFAHTAPEGEYDDEGYGQTGAELAGQFAQVGACWAEEGPEAVSSFTASSPPKVLFRFNAWLVSEFPPPAGSLIEFMVLQAVRMASQKTAMRRCSACGRWVELTRLDRRFCNVACRKRQARQRAED